MNISEIVPPTLATQIIISPFNNGHWVFPEQLGKGVGFIYVIRDNVLNRWYLGKKNFLGKGVKNKGMDTGWRKYTSSSPLMKELFGHRPMCEFDFIAIEQYTTLGGLAYAETWTLCFLEAPTTKEIYNTRIEKISFTVREPISQRHKDRIDLLKNKANIRRFYGDL